MLARADLQGVDYTMQPAALFRVFHTLLPSMSEGDLGYLLLQYSEILYFCRLLEIFIFSAILGNKKVCHLNALVIYCIHKLYLICRLLRYSYVRKHVLPVQAYRVFKKVKTIV